MSIVLDQRLFGDTLQAASQALLPEAVQHFTALRSGTARGAEWTGWFDYPRKHGFHLAAGIKDVVQNIGCHYDLVVVIGIGGSYLGTRAVHEALSHSYQDSLAPSTHAGRLRPQVVYAGHTLSEREFIDLIDLLDARSPLLTVISKSGTTIEPGIAFRVLRRYLEDRYGASEAARRIIAITDPEQGALRSLVTSMNYQSFAIPPDVGGRFSVLTPVGLVPLALAGHDIDALLTGADQTFAAVQAAPASHPALAFAAARVAAFRAGKAVELLAFTEPRLHYFVEWYKQLFGESEGKSGQGLFPAGLSLTTDLHSLGQWVQDGPRQVIETFLAFQDEGRRFASGLERRLQVPALPDNVDELRYVEGLRISAVNAEAQRGTRLAHADGGVPGMELRCGILDATSLGELIAFFEIACGIGAAMLGVNPYDQPGVESYKKNLFALVGRPGSEALGAELRQRLSAVKTT